MFKQSKRLENLKRAKEIVSVIVKYGLGYYINLASLRRYLGFGTKFAAQLGKENDRIARLTLPQRLRRTAEELGPTFIKFGQILSTRPDILPRKYIDELSNLQDSVPPFDFSEAEELFLAEYGQDIGEVFAELDKKPVAAASLSQVHRAKLPSGETVAVKFQRPHIRKTIETDVAILYRLAAIASRRFSDSMIYRPDEIIKEFSHVIRRELDFMAEAHNIEIFRNNFSASPDVHIPEVYWDYTGEKIITMEFIAGTRINDVIRSRSGRFNKKLIARRLVNAVLKQVFEDGFFHGDPHPGNIFVLAGDRIAFLDFGIVGRLDAKTMDQLAEALIGVIAADADRIIRVWQDMEIVEPLTDIASIRSEIKNFLDNYYNLPLKELKVGRMFQEIIDIMARYRIKAPVSLALLSKALGYVESISRELDPDLNMVEFMKPYAEKLVKRKYAFATVSRRGIDLARELAQMAEKLPHELYLLSKGLREGKLHIGFKLKHIEQLSQVIDRASNRLSFSLIIAALIVSSSVIINFNKGPFLFGYSALGIAGYLIAGVLGLGLVLSMLRRGRL